MGRKTLIKNRDSTKRKDLKINKLRWRSKIPTKTLKKVVAIAVIIKENPISE